MPSELLLEWGSWDIVDTVWFLTEWRLLDEWQCTTAICSLRGHRVHADDHSDDTGVEEEESKDTDSHNAVEEDFVLWLPLNVTILIDLSRDASGARRDKHHHKLNQERPCGHVHAILAPSLRRAPPVGEHQCTQTGAHKQDGQHWAEKHDALAVLHGLSQQGPFKACELLDRDGSPDPDVHEEELEGQVDDALDGW